MTVRGFFVVLAHTRPHRLMFLSGLGVAGSLLGAVVATFALASAVVAFEIWPSNPSSVELSSLTVAPPQQLKAARPALVLPAPTRTQAAGAPATATTARASGITIPRRSGGQTAAATATTDGSTAYDPGAPSTGEISGRPGSDTPGPAPAVPAEGPLTKVGGAVDNTTRSLGGTLRSTTDSLGKHLEPISPTLGKTVAKTGVSLAETVQNLGVIVAGLLGHRTR
jgi:hypothetical protein